MSAPNERPRSERERGQELLIRAQAIYLYGLAANADALHAQVSATTGHGAPMAYGSAIRQAATRLERAADEYAALRFPEEPETKAPAERPHTFSSVKEARRKHDWEPESDPEAGEAVTVYCERHRGGERDVADPWRASIEARLAALEVRHDD